MDKKMNSAAKKILFQNSVYSAEAVKLAAYIYSDRAEIKLSSSAGGLQAEVFAQSGKNPGGVHDASVSREFANEVLNQQCRLDLAVRNGKIANMIVTKTLLSALGETKKTKVGEL